MTWDPIMHIKNEEHVQKDAQEKRTSQALIKMSKVSLLGM